MTPSATSRALPGSTVPQDLAPWAPSRALLTAATVAGLLVVAAYAGGVLLPHLAAGLHHVPLAELTSGAHDPEDVWPAGGLLGGFLGLAGLVAATLGFLVTVPAAAVVACGLRAARAARRPVAGHAVVLALLVAVSVLRFTPLGAALATWMLD